MRTQTGKRITTLLLTFALAAGTFAGPINTAYASQVNGEEQSTKASSTMGIPTDYSKSKEVAKEKAQALLDYYGVNSVQYALIDNGEIVISDQAGTYSKTDKSVTLNKDHMYGIASISKVYGAAAVMKLVDEGKIDLDAPVTRYVTDFKMADSRYKDITVRMLLNHSSGLMGSTFNVLFGENDANANKKLIAELKTQRLKADPGAFSVYCNDGFTLAEIVVERVTNKTFTKYLEDTFFTPLGLKNTKSTMSTFSRARLARTYYPGFSNSLPTENFNAIATGGLYASAENICKFATTFMKDNNGILSEKSIEATGQKEYLNGIWPKGTDSVIEYGLGWDSVNTFPFNRYGIRAWSKGGDSYLYHGNLTVLPDYNIAVAVVSSEGSSGYNQIMAQEILLTVLEERRLISSIKSDVKTQAPLRGLMPTGMMDFSGYYLSSLNMLVDIQKDGTMSLSYIDYPDMPVTTFVYTHDMNFQSLDGGAKIQFVKEKNGEVYLQQDGYSTYPYLGQTATYLYMAQKVEPNSLDDKVAKAWEKREGKVYFAVNLPYNSPYYMMSAIAAGTSTKDNAPGFLGQNKIESEDFASAYMQIPGAIGRDLFDAKFSTSNSVEYVNIRGTVYMDEANIKNISQKKFTTTIAKNGNANWYKIPASAGGKTINVSVPAKSAYAVYDMYGECMNYTVVTKNKKTKLPKGGYIVFVGNPGSKFTIQY